MFVALQVALGLLNVNGLTGEFQAQTRRFAPEGEARTGSASSQTPCQLALDVDDC